MLNYDNYAQWSKVLCLANETTFTSQANNIKEIDIGAHGDFGWEIWRAKTFEF